MPTDLSDVQTGGVDLLFADDLKSGVQFKLREASAYEAEEVREELSTDTPEFGKWLPVEQDDSEAWVVALGELVEELQSYENPQAVTFEVTRCRKSGTKQTSPYEVVIEPVAGDVNQSSL